MKNFVSTQDLSEHPPKKKLSLDDLEILFDDLDFIVINKPANFLAVPDRFAREKENLHSLLETEFGKVHPVHRLDKETSGAIVFAKTPLANENLSKQFEKHLVEKTYLGLVVGKPSEKFGIIEAPISESTHRPGTVHIDFRHGKPSRTEYKIVEEFASYSLLELFPKTGRQHQIRVHLAFLGFPLAVDSVYGNSEKLLLSNVKKRFKQKSFREEKPLLSRLSLHASKINFFHFRLEKEVEITAPLPNDFSVLLKQLRKWGK